MDLGNPASYLVLEDGTPVLSADGEQIEGIYERGVATPDDTVTDDLGHKLRRAWDYLSGRY